ncbi:MAG: PhzF family phenazine biosynthesis protein [Candidatus Acidiferrales bacterium]
MKRRIYQLDVFTSKPFTGNRLAVVTDGDGLSRTLMQAIAKEMNHPETVFVQRPTNNRALARLRIFTTTQELPLAGHPVIGTWFLLAELGVVPAREGAVHILQQTGAGILPVEISFENSRPVNVTMTQKPAVFRPAKFSATALEAALGIRRGDLHAQLPMEFVSTGIFNLMLPLRDASILKRLRMAISPLARLLDKQGVLAYCFALAGKAKVRSRGMVPWELIEDPATGSAGGSLGAYLVRHKKLRVGEELSITQGVEMGRPSHIRVQVSEQKGRLTPRVSGSAVRIWEGHIDA